jgi:hypothetical protein
MFFLLWLGDQHRARLHDGEPAWSGPAVAMKKKELTSDHG